jgi:hypothetical protein
VDVLNEFYCISTKLVDFIKNVGKEQAFFLISINHNYKPTDHTAHHKNVEI